MIKQGIPITHPSPESFRQLTTLTYKKSQFHSLWPKNKNHITVAIQWIRISSHCFHLDGVPRMQSSKCNTTKWTQVSKALLSQSIKYDKTHWPSRAPRNPSAPENFRHLDQNYLNFTLSGRRTRNQQLSLFGRSQGSS